jgi:Glycosyl hydrolase family 12
MCVRYQHMPAANRLGENFIIRNDNYGGQPECIANKGRRANFSVTRSAAHSTAEPVAFPYIFLGCSWGLCTPGSGLPARVSTLGRLATTWVTSQHAGGSWDATYDIWFSRRRMTTGQATGGELMIWLGSRRRSLPRRHLPVIWADHARWYVDSWLTHHHGSRWRLIQFRRVRPAWRAARLRLRPFIRLLERRRWIRPWYWLLNVEAGFELWWGGAGLATRWFSARV